MGGVFEEARTDVETAHRQLVEVWESLRYTAGLVDHSAPRVGEGCERCRANVDQLLAELRQVQEALEVLT